MVVKIFQDEVTHTKKTMKIVTEMFLKTLKILLTNLASVY